MNYRNERNNAKEQERLQYQRTPFGDAFFMNMLGTLTSISGSTILDKEGDLEHIHELICSYFPQQGAETEIVVETFLDSIHKLSRELDELLDERYVFGVEEVRARLRVIAATFRVLRAETLGQKHTNDENIALPSAIEELSASLRSGFVGNFNTYPITNPLTGLANGLYGHVEDVLHDTQKMEGRNTMVFLKTAHSVVLSLLSLFTPILPARTTTDGQERSGIQPKKPTYVGISFDEESLQNLKESIEQRIAIEKERIAVQELKTHQEEIATKISTETQTNENV